MARQGQTSFVAVPVMNASETPTLCPFFGKCEGILVLDPHGRPSRFVPNRERTAETLCDLIIAAGADRLVCGYIGEPEKQRLRAAGVDIRLGSCACSIEELASCFCELPEA